MTGTVNMLDATEAAKARQIQQLGKLSSARMGRMSSSQADASAEEFEAMFLAQMMSHMFEGVQLDPLFGDRASNDVYKSMLVDEYSKLFAKAGGIGVADHVKREILRLQEVHA